MRSGPSVFRLDEKVALVVGAASGIGRAAAFALAQSGATVICADVNLSRAEEAAHEIVNGEGRAAAISLDITNPDSVKAGIAKCTAEYGRIDVLVSTPSVNVRKRLLAYSEQEVDRVVNINLKGTFRLTRAVASVMSDGGGSIILMSSIRSLLVEPGQGIYAATKAALVQLARTFAVELAGNKIRVNAVAPGVVDTPLTEQIKKNEEWYSAYANRSALKRWARPEELAWPIVFLASEASSYITGTVLFVDGGWTAIDGRYEPPL